jgi:tetratricopeptide (TPR) repeat protein
MRVIKDIQAILKKSDFDFYSKIADCTKKINASLSKPPAPPPAKSAIHYFRRGYLRCLCEFKDNRYVEAIEDISLAISIESDPAKKVEYYAIRGYAHFLCGNQQQVIDDCERVIKQTKDNETKAFSRQLRGNVYMNQKKYQEAIADFKEALIFNAMSPGLLDKFREAYKKQNA